MDGSEDAYLFGIFCTLFHILRFEHVDVLRFRLSDHSVGLDSRDGDDHWKTLILHACLAHRFTESSTAKSLTPGKINQVMR